ncbi:hypothetical protein ACFL2A_07405, partial [Thermodesulfobacteriota bacterium]
MQRNDKGQFIFWSGADRATHIVLFIASFFALLTGIPLKYFEYNFAKIVYDFFGSFTIIKLIHNASGIIIIIILILHLASIAYIWIRTEKFLQVLEMRPTINDLKNILNNIKYIF